MIKVILAVAKPAKAVPTPPVNVIRYYNFTVIQTASDNASVLVEDDLGSYYNSTLKYLITKAK